MADRGPLAPWPDPPPGSRLPRSTQVWNVLQNLRRAGWLRPRRIGCLLLVLLVLLFAALWAVGKAVNATTAMFRNDPPPVAGSPFEPVAPPRPAGSGSPTVDRITERGSLIVAIDEVPGMAERSPTGEGYQGFDVELLGLIARDLRVDPTNIVFKPLPASTRDAVLGRHEADIAIGGYQMTPQQPADVEVAGPYLESRLWLAVPAASTVTSPDSLGGNGKVCVASDSPAADLLRQRLGSRLVTSGSLDSCAKLIGNRISALAGKPVEAVAEDQAALRALPGMANGTLKEVGAPLGSVDYGIALPPGDELFRQRVTAVLRTAIEDGTWARLYAQYLGTPVPTPPALPR